MRTVSLRLADLPKIRIEIGYMGEQNHTAVIIDCKEIFDSYPNAAATMVAQPPVGDLYPVVLTRSGDKVTWNVTPGDVLHQGNGSFQLTFTDGSGDDAEIIKTAYGSYFARASLQATGEPPEGIDNWIQDATEVLQKVQDAIPTGGTENQVLAKASDEDYDLKWVDQSGGGGGTSDYNDLTNKPKIGGTTLSGNKSLSELGIASESDVNAKYTKPGTGIPSTDLAETVQTSLNKADSAYQKPGGGIPASDIASGVIPEPTSIIDDTAGDGDTDKVWSADKSADEKSALMNALQGKISEPSSEGTSGQVLTTDGNGGRVWATPSGGGSSTFIDTTAGEAYTIQDSKAASLNNMKVYGKTVQSLTPGWQLVPFSDATNWYAEPSAKVSYTHNDATNSIAFTVTGTNTNHQVGLRRFQTDISSIISGKTTFYISADIDSNKDDGFTAKLYVIGCASTNGTSWKWSKSISATQKGSASGSVTITDEQATGTKTLMILVHVTGLTIGDTFSVSNYRVTADSTLKKYTVSNCQNAIVGVGSDSITITDVLRGVPHSSGQIMYANQKYLCDVMDFHAGTITRYIDSDIDLETDEEIDDYSDFILETPVVEQIGSTLIEEYEGMATTEPTTTVTLTSIIVPKLYINYVADSQKYVDIRGNYVVTPEMFGAAGDGITDDTEAIRLALNRSGFVSFGKGKQYRCTSYLYVPEMSDIIIKGNSSRIIFDGTQFSFATNNTYCIYNDSDSLGKGKIEIHDLAVDCGGSSVDDTGYETLPSNAIGGFRIYGFDTVDLDGVEITNTVTGMGAWFVCRKFTARHCYIHDLGRYKDVEKIIYTSGYEYGGFYVTPYDATANDTLCIIENNVFERIGASAVMALRYANRKISNNVFRELVSGIMEDTHCPIVDDATLEISGNLMERCQGGILNADINAVDRMSGKNYTVKITDNTLTNGRGAENLYFHGYTHLWIITRLANDSANAQVLDATVLFERNTIRCTDTTPGQVGTDESGLTTPSLHMYIGFVNIKRLSFKDNVLINGKATSRVIIADLLSANNDIQIEGNRTYGKWKYELGGSLSPIKVINNKDNIISEVPDSDDDDPVVQYSDFTAVFDNVIASIFAEGNSTDSAKPMLYMRQAYGAGKKLVCLNNEAKTILGSANNLTHLGSAYFTANVTDDVYDGTSSFDAITETGTIPYS